MIDFLTTAGIVWLALCLVALVLVMLWLRAHPEVSDDLLGDGELAEVIPFGSGGARHGRDAA